LRIAIFGDVHGNLPALEAMVQDLRTTTPDLLVCLGDLVDGFGHPREVVELVRSLEPVATVLGNAEWRVREWPASIATMRPNAEILFRWLVDELGPQNRAYLAGLPTVALITPDAPRAEQLLAFHGVPEDPFVGIRPPRDEWPSWWIERFAFFARDEALVPDALAQVSANPHAPDFLICAHTHARMDRTWLSPEGRTLRIVNPGPVCFGNRMYAGRMDALYALLDRASDGWRVTWRDLDYDKRAAADSVARNPIVTPYMEGIAADLRAEARLSC
jgi:predicted phosphodiesterase